MKIGVLGDINDPDLALLVEELQKQNPHIEIVSVDKMSAREISLGYKADFDEYIPEMSELRALHEAMTRRSLSRKLTEWPTSAVLPKRQEAWQGKRKTPWRKRR